MARRTLHDRYFKLAKSEGYLARSAYKLLQIQEDRKPLKRGDHVLDLGCAPGSWLQAASEIVGPQGRVVGADLAEVRHSMPANVTAIVGDVFEITPAQILPDSDSRFDVVLSDMAPRTSGHGDDLRSAHLCRRVLELARGVLAPGGNLVMKILEGAEYPDVLNETREMFARVRAYKPKASRDASKEIYIIGRTMKPA